MITIPPSEEAPKPCPSIGWGRPGGGVTCSFCGKHQRGVRKIIAGDGVYICDECIRLCNDIIREDIVDEGSEPTSCAPTSAPAVPVERDVPDWLTAVLVSARHLAELCRVAGLPPPIQTAAAELTGLLERGSAPA